MTGVDIRRFWAAGAERTVVAFLRLGVDAEMRDNFGQMPLLVAARNGHTGI